MLAGEWGRAPAEARALARHIMAFWDERTGVFVACPPAGDIEPRSRVFAETGDAMWVARQDPAARRAWIAAALTDDDRRETVLLAARPRSRRDHLPGRVCCCRRGRHGSALACSGVGRRCRRRDSGNNSRCIARPHRRTRPGRPRGLGVPGVPGDGGGKPRPAPCQRYPAGLAIRTPHRGAAAPPRTAPRAGPCPRRARTRRQSAGDRWSACRPRRRHGRLPRRPRPQAGGSRPPTPRLPAPRTPPPGARRTQAGHGRGRLQAGQASAWAYPGGRAGSEVRGPARLRRCQRDVPDHPPRIRASVLARPRPVDRAGIREPRTAARAHNLRRPLLWGANGALLGRVGGPPAGRRLLSPRLGT